MAVGAHRCETDATVAHHDSGDAMPTRRRHLRVPRDLTVVVSVDVDPSGGDRQTGSIYFATATSVDLAHLGDQPIGDCNITVDCAGSGSVDHIAASDHHVMHCRSLELSLHVALRRGRDLHKNPSGQGDDCFVLERGHEHAVDFDVYIEDRAFAV